MEETATEKQQLTSQHEQATEALAAKLESMDLESSGDAQVQATSSKAEETNPRRLIVYSRKQILYLSKSPLVKPPDGMPSFKSWFGSVATAFLGDTILTRCFTVNSANKPSHHRRKRLSPRE